MRSRKRSAPLLQHEAVRREQSKAPVHAFDGERPDPGVELLRRQLAAEGLEAAVPEEGGVGHRQAGKEVGHRQGPGRFAGGPVAADESRQIGVSGKGGPRDRSIRRDTAPSDFPPARANRRPVYAGRGELYPQVLARRCGPGFTETLTDTA